MFIHLSSLGSPHAPFIVIEVQVGTVSLRHWHCNDSVLNRDTAFLSHCCVSCFLWAFICRPWCHSAGWSCHSCRIWRPRKRPCLAVWRWKQNYTVSEYLPLDLRWLKPISNFSYLVQAGVDWRWRKRNLLLFCRFFGQCKNSGQVHKQILKCWQWEKITQIWASEELLSHIVKGIKSWNDWLID